MLVEKVNFELENINSEVKHYKVTSIAKSSTSIFYHKIYTFGFHLLEAILKVKYYRVKFAMKFKKKHLKIRKHKRTTIFDCFGYLYCKGNCENKKIKHFSLVFSVTVYAREKSY